MHERQKGAARRKSETAAIGPRRLARPFKTSGSGASEKRVVGALLGFRVSALGFKDNDGRPPTKAGKSGEKLKKGPGPHTARTNVW